MKRYRAYFFNVVLIWLIVFFYNTSGYYETFLRSDTRVAIFYFAFIYTVLGFVYYTVVRSKITKTKGTIIFNTIIRLAKGTRQFVLSPSKKNFPRISQYQKTTILFIIVKVFFLPIMLNFAFQNFNALRSQLLASPSFFSLLNINSFNLISFPILISVIFLIDTLYFSFGYTVEAKFLKNKIRSVEPTMIGWAVALISYPPFNTMFTRYTNWYPNLYYTFGGNVPLMFGMRVFIIVLLLFYLSATLALGAKCSNLTNRGIVSRGPYSIVRHPAYISKNLSWWLVVIPLFSWPAYLSMFVWSFIYHLRTVTEERHLRSDPDYVAYCKKVRYRYIPYVY